MADIIQPMQSLDTEAILKIYSQSIDGRQATIVTRVLACEKWDFSHIHVYHMDSESEDVMFYWDTLPKGLQRKVCGGVTEVSSYVYGILQKIGIVSILLECLITYSKEADLWSLQSQIYPEKSIRIILLKKHGFGQNGIQEKIVLMIICTISRLWLDVVFIEQRSERVGD